MGVVREILSGVAECFRWFVTIAPWEQAVRVRFGKHVRLLGPGVAIRIPVVDRIYRQSIRRRFCLVPAQTITTVDGRTVTIAGSLGYRVEDMLTLYDTLHDAGDTIVQMAQGAIASFVASHELADCSADALRDHVLASIDIARFGLGEPEYVVSDFTAVRTYRLIQGSPREWSGSASLDTTRHETATGGAP